MPTLRETPTTPTTRRSAAIVEIEEREETDTIGTWEEDEIADLISDKPKRTHMSQGLKEVVEEVFPCKQLLSLFNDPAIRPKLPNLDDKGKKCSEGPAKIDRFIIDLGTMEGVTAAFKSNNLCELDDFPSILRRMYGSLFDRHEDAMIKRVIYSKNKKIMHLVVYCRYYVKNNRHTSLKHDIIGHAAFLLGVESTMLIYIGVSNKNHYVTNDFVSEKTLGGNVAATSKKNQLINQ